MARKDRGKPTLGILAREQLWQDTVSLARSGDMDCLKLIFDRLFPKLKAVEQPKPFQLTGDSPTEKANSILDAVANGELTVSDGTQLLTALSNMMRIAEIDDISKRLELLESSK